MFLFAIKRLEKESLSFYCVERSSSTAATNGDYGVGLKLSRN